MRWRRVSSSASTPRSVFARIKRPNPCFNDSTACGTWNSANALRPSSCKASTRAATTGSLGTANGSRSTMTHDSCSPGTSTPCQKLAVANSTAPSVFLNRSSSTERGAVPCKSTGKDTRERTRQEISFIPAFVPIHEILLIGFEQKHEFLPQLEAAPRQPRELFRFAGLRGHFGFQALQGRE